MFVEVLETSLLYELFMKNIRNSCAPLHSFNIRELKKWMFGRYQTYLKQPNHQKENKSLEIFTVVIFSIYFRETDLEKLHVLHVLKKTQRQEPAI